METAPNIPIHGRTVLQVIPELGAGGAERTTIEVAEAIVKAGGRALVASLGGRLEADLRAVGGALIRIDVKTKQPLAVWRNAGRLAAIVETEGVDILHARSRACGWSAYLAARRTGAGFVTTYHGAYGDRPGPKRFYNSVMARGDVVIANSDWIADHVAATHRLPAARIVTIPRGVDLDAFAPKKVDAGRAASIRAAWGLSPGDGRLVLLLPARLTRWKGHGVALEALAALAPAEREGLVLVFSGDAQGRDAYVLELSERIDALGLGGGVLLAGHCSDMPAAYLAADIVLAPSIRPEAFGRVAAEAGAMGRAVIVSDHGGGRETVIDGETGVRAAPGDPAALAAAIRTLVAIGPAARAAMGAAAAKRIAERFSKTRLQAETLGVYSQVRGKGE